MEIHIDYNGNTYHGVATPYEDSILDGEPFKFKLVIDEEDKGMLTRTGSGWESDTLEPGLAEVIGKYLHEWYR